MTIHSCYAMALSIAFAPLVGFLAIFATQARGSDAAEFKPIVEAEMPEGFPRYTAVEDVQIKQYPAYRKAEADAKAMGSFWRLFSHIKKNDIPMTAPVEMRYADGERPRESSMAFLYNNPEVGQVGRDGSVEVIDVPPMTVVSTGVRGPQNSESVAAARDRLEKWLEVNKERYAAEGQMRVMAYNSPFVPRNRNYFEVEIPIRPVDPTSSLEESEKATEKKSATLSNE